MSELTLSMNTDGLIWLMFYYVPTRVRPDEPISPQSRADLQFCIDHLHKIIMETPVENKRLFKEYVMSVCYLRALISTEDGNIPTNLARTYIDIHKSVFLDEELENKVPCLLIQRYWINDIETYTQLWGTYFVSLSQNYIRQHFKIVRLPDSDVPEDIQAYKTIFHIIGTFAPNCIFSNDNNNIDTSNVIATKLDPWRYAQMEDNETPWKALSQQCYDQANKIGHAVLDMTANKQFAAINIHSPTCDNSINFTVNFLRELIDHYDGKILFNTRIAHQISAISTPSFFICCNGFDIGIGQTYGYCTHDTLYLPPRKNPLLGLLFAFFKLRATPPLPKFQLFADLCSAILSPAEVNPQSLYYPYVKDI